MSEHAAGLVEKRKNSGVSQEEMCPGLKVSRLTLSRYEAQSRPAPEGFWTRYEHELVLIASRKARKALEAVA